MTRSAQGCAAAGAAAAALASGRAALLALAIAGCGGAGPEELIDTGAPDGLAASPAAFDPLSRLADARAAADRWLDGGALVLVAGAPDGAQMRWTFTFGDARSTYADVAVAPDGVAVRAHGPRSYLLPLLPVDAGSVRVTAPGARTAAAARAPGAQLTRIELRVLPDEDGRLCWRFWYQDRAPLDVDAAPALPGT